MSQFILRVPPGPHGARHQRIFLVTEDGQEIELCPSFIRYESDANTDATNLTLEFVLPSFKVEVVK